MQIKKSRILGVTILFIVVALVLLGGRLFETNEKGHVQIKQEAITGKMSVRTTPGTYMQLFGDITTLNKQYTYFFTKDSDSEDDEDTDNTIEVRFVDGSLCSLEVTTRLALPVSDDQIKDLLDKESYSSEKDIEEKLVKPWQRKVLRHTANMMTARESYKEKRQDFVTWSEAQFEKGLYKTKDVKKDVMDLISGKPVKKTFKEIVVDSLKNPIIDEPAPLTRLGFDVVSYEVKRFGYAPIVKQQIEEQQTATMNVATQQAKAAEAKQKAITAEAAGLEAVMVAKYQEETIKAREVVKAERELEVAKLARMAAAETKQRDILLGQGIAAKKKLIMQADGALEIKANVIRDIHKYWSDAHKTRPVPQTMFIGGGASDGALATDTQISTFMNLLNAQAMKSLSLDLSLPNK